MSLKFLFLAIICNCEDIKPHNNEKLKFDVQMKPHPEKRNSEESLKPTFKNSGLSVLLSSLGSWQMRHKAARV